MKTSCTFILICLLFSCSENRQFAEEKAPSSTEDNSSTILNDSLNFKSANGEKHEFRSYANASSQLNEAKVEAFTRKARLQIQDFFDYLELMTNSEYAKELQEHALSMSKETLIPDTPIVNLEGDKIGANQFLDKLFQGSAQLKCGDIFIHENPSVKKVDTSYVFSFEVSANCNSVQTSILIRCHLKKESKKFGSDELSIWNVRIAELLIEKP